MSGIKDLCSTARAGRSTSRTRTLHTMPGGVIASALTTTHTVYPRTYGKVLHTDQPAALEGLTLIRGCRSLLEPLADDVPPVPPVPPAFRHSNP